MAINNINWNALNTLNGVINNACAICNEQNKKAADMIPAPFKFTGNVKVKLDVHVDSLREMPS